MARVIVLDSTPLGLATGPPGSPQTKRCRAWLSDLVDAGARIVVPEICDYEYLPITTDVMRLAAGFWAALQAVGQPTASDLALDADAILAAQASLAGGSGDVVTVATSNVRHLTRFPGIDAREWRTITT